jgi:hypothetical protein
VLQAGGHGQRLRKALRLLRPAAQWLKVQPDLKGEHPRLSHERGPRGRVRG